MTPPPESVDLAPDEKLCPYCAETIKKAAIKCRYCQSDLSDDLSHGAAPPPAPPAPVEETGSSSELLDETPPPPVPLEDAEPPPVPLEDAEPPPVERSRDLDSSPESSFLASTRLLVILLVLCAVLLAALGGVWWWSKHPGEEKAQGAITSTAARDSGLEAAKTLTEKVLSYNWQTLDQDMKTAEGVLAPSFRSQYVKTMAGVRDQTVKNQVKLTATVVAPSIVSASKDKVVALVFVNQVTTAKGTTNQRLDQNRVLVTLTRSGGEWRVSKMTAF